MSDIVSTLRQIAGDTPDGGSVMTNVSRIRDAIDEIERLRKLLEPSVWTCPDQEGSAWSCPDDAMDGADTGDSSELEGWARVAAVRATVQPDNSVKIENLI